MLFHFCLNESFFTAQMCRDRGYDVPAEDVAMSLDGFKTKFGSTPSTGHPSRIDLNMKFSKPGSEGKPLRNGAWEG